MIAASQNLQFFDGIVTKNSFNFSYCYWLVILGVGLCPLTWLGSPKDSKYFLQRTPTRLRIPMTLMVTLLSGGSPWLPPAW